MTGPPQNPREHGFTLIELLVYVTFMVVILSIIGGMLISSLRVENDVRDATSASDVGQLISQSVQTGVRNASAVSLQNLGTDQLLRARTASAGATLQWVCQSWYVTPENGGSIYTKRSAPAAAIPAPTSTTLPTWIKLGDGIAVAGGPVFGGVDGRVTLTLRLDAGDATPVALDSTATLRTLASRSDPCF